MNVPSAVADREALGKRLPRARIGRDGRPVSRTTQVPTRTPDQITRRIACLRGRHRLGPLQIAAHLNMPTSTVHAMFVRYRITGSPTSTGSQPNRSAGTSTPARGDAGRRRHQVRQHPQRWRPPLPHSSGEQKNAIVTAHHNGRRGPAGRAGRAYRPLAPQKQSAEERSSPGCIAKLPSPRRHWEQAPRQADQLPGQHC